MICVSSINSIKVNQSNILNSDNINVFNELIQSNLIDLIDKLNSNIRFNLVYSSELDGNDCLIMQSKLMDKSNLMFLVKTDDGKTFGIYTSQTLNYNNQPKYDNQLSLFSVDLNEWFNVQTKSELILPCQFNVNDYIGYGLQLAYFTIVILDSNNKSYYTNLKIYSDKVFNMKGYKLSEVFGGQDSDDSDYTKLTGLGIFTDINIVDIEVYQLEFDIE